MDAYMTSVFAYLKLKQTTLTFHHLDDLGKEKSSSIEQVNLAQCHLTVV